MNAEEQMDDMHIPTVDTYRNVIGTHYSKKPNLTTLSNCTVQNLEALKMDKRFSI